MKKRTVIKQKTKTILITIVAIILFALSFILISSSLNIRVVEEREVLNYNSNSKVNYVVNLKDNDHFTEKVLPEGEQYITSVIDNIEIDYKYSFSSAKMISGKYSYKIVANVNADHKINSSTSKRVWSKDYVLVSKEDISLNNESTFNIDKKIKINYDEYNKIINDFKRDYMLAVQSKVDVYMYVMLNGNYDNKEFVEEATLLTSIPLSEQTISISTDYNKNKTNALTEMVTVDRFNNIYIFVLGILLSLIAIITIAWRIIIIVADNKKQSKYIKQLKKFMHDYDDIIATVKSKPNTNGLKLIEFIKFEELVNAQDDLRVPIIFCETKVNEEGYFFLISETCAYYYVLRNE